MPAVANLVVKDRAATPNSITYNMFEKNVDGTFRWRVATGTPISDPKISIRSRLTAAGKQNYKIGIAVPVVQTQTVNGVSSPVLLRTAYINVDMTFDQASTATERSYIVNYLSTLLDPTQNAWLVDQALRDGGGMY